MQRNFDSTKEMVIAEPLYILLASLGHPDAHEAVRLLTLESQKTGKTLRELLVEKTEFFPYWDQLTPKQREILENPEKYTGWAEQKTESSLQSLGETIKYEELLNDYGKH